MWQNQDYKIEVRIQSEAIFNSGEGERNLVHAKVLADRNGFVYFHAKTFKGQLKAQAFWLLKQYKSFDTEKAISFFHSIVNLFGINMHELYEVEKYCPECKNNYLQQRGKDNYQQDGILKFGHLEIDERIRGYFIELQRKDEQEGYYNISPDDLIEAQTHIRTGIQLEDGIVKDKMMATYHTVKQGLIFYSTLSFSEEPSKNYVEDLRRIVHSFRRMGAGIHRGRGAIEARLLIDGKDLDMEKDSERR